MEPGVFVCVFVFVCDCVFMLVFMFVVVCACICLCVLCAYSAAAESAMLVREFRTLAAGQTVERSFADEEKHGYFGEGRNADEY